MLIRIVGCLLLLAVAWSIGLGGLSAPDPHSPGTYHPTPTLAGVALR